MAKRRPVHGTSVVAGVARRSRRALIFSTALQSTGLLLLTFPAAAQLSPQARPQGGVVSAGQASVNQTSAQTTVSQTSQRAVVDWRSFDVGSQHTVAFQQPGASAITLNRVAGPDPSQIAGRITANGQVAIVNGSGVVFQPGSVVDVQSLVVSSANISNRNFMAGRGPAGQLVFDQPGRPDARVSNAGTITVKQGGLAALVAPQVANSGVINARMGKVVLAGAEAHTIDLYGDGLMSIDVTRQVRQAPNGGAALVTNTGTIAADGGTVVLTAQAVDGMVSNLINAGGTIRANSLAGHPGAVVMHGVGGSISVAGDVRVDGRGPSTPGGTVEVTATDTVAVGPAARISAAGRGGGGVIALGTTLDRARAQGGGVPDGASRAVTIAPGARIVADGRGRGSGGKVAVMSTERTVMAGAISARGGRHGGDGGNVEISGRGSFSLTGSADVSAPAGRSGTILLDPYDLQVVDGTADNGSLTSGDFTTSGGTSTLPQSAGGGTNTTDTITNYTIDHTLTGDVVLQASHDIIVSGAIDRANSLTLTADHSVVINNTITIRTGALQITAGAGGRTDSQIAINQPISSNQDMTLSAQSNALTVFANNASVPRAGGTIEIDGSYQGNGGTLTADTVYFNNNGTFYYTYLPTIAAQTVRLKAGNLMIQNYSLATRSADNSGGFVNVGTAALDLQATTVTEYPGSTIIARLLTGTIANGASLISKDSSGIIRNSIGAVGDFSAGGNVALDNARSLAITGNLVATSSTYPTVTLNVNGDLTGSGSITADRLTGSVTGGVNLSGNNMIRAIGSDSVTGFSAGTGFTLNDNPGGAVLTVLGPLATTQGAIALTVPAGATIAVAGSIKAPSGQILLQADTVTASGPISTGSGGTVAIAPLTFGGGVQLAAIPTSQITTGTLAIGSLDGGRTIRAGAIMANQPFTLGTTAQTLALYAPTVDVGAPIAATLPNQRIVIASDQLNFTSATYVGSLTTAASGEVALAPSSAGTTVDLSQVPLGRITTGTLSIGSLDDGASIRANAITVPAAFSLGTTNLSLYATNNVTVSAPVTANQQISVETAALTVNGTGSLNTVAAGGEVSIAPATQGGTVSLAALPLGSINTATLEVGSLDNGTTIRAGSIIIPSAVSLGTINLALYTTGDITETGSGAIATAGTLTGRAGGAVNLTGINQIATLGNFAAAGTISLVQAPQTKLTIAGALSASGVGLQADMLDYSNGSINVGGGVAAFAPATAGQAFSIPPLTNLTAGTLALGSIDGGTTVTAGSIGIPSVVSLGMTNLALYSTGDIAETGAGAIVTAGMLTGRAGGAVSLAGANQIATLGNLTASGTITVVQAPQTKLTIAGALNASGVRLQTDALDATNGSINAGSGVVAFAPATPGQAFSIPSLTNVAAGTLVVGSVDGGITVTAGSISIPSAVSLGTTNLALYTTGDIVETGTGAIATSGTLTGRSGGAVSLTGANQIATLGSFAASGPINLVQAPQTKLTIAGALSAAAVGLVVDALDYSNGSINVGSGTIAVAPATTGLAFSIPSLTNLTAGTLALGSTDGGATITAGSISIPSVVSLGATNLALYSTGDIVETGTGAIVTAGTLTGQAGGGAILSGANQVSTLGNLAAGTSAAGGNLQFTDTAPLTITGAVSSSGDLTLTGSPSVTTTPGSLLSAGRTLAITVQKGSVDLSGTLSAPKIAVLAPSTTLTGGTILTGGDIIPANTPIEDLPNFYNSRAGAFFAANRFIQRGTTQVVALNGYSRATVRVDLDPISASIQSLNAPSANLIINPNGGTVSLGAVNVARLNLLNSFSRGSTALVTFASGSARLVTLPSLNPLKDVSLGFFGGQDDEDLIVPNISDQGM